MTDNKILEILEGEWGDSVSAGDAPVSSSVSGGDVPAYYEINFYSLPSPAPEPETETTVYTLWYKPLEQYTVSEGLLLLLVIIVVVVLIWSAIKGGFKWLT